MFSLLVLTGHVGIFMMLLAYLMLIVGKVKPIDIKYIMLNMCGTVMVIVAMMTHHDLPMAQALIAWMLISFYGFVLHNVKGNG